VRTVCQSGAGLKTSPEGLLYRWLGPPAVVDLRAGDVLIAFTDGVP
jgi:hypothetical protein